MSIHAGTLTIVLFLSTLAVRVSGEERGEVVETKYRCRDCGANFRVQAPAK